MCEQCNKLRAELSEFRQAVGLATTAVPDMVMDADHPIEMMQKVVGETHRLRAELAKINEQLVEQIEMNQERFDGRMTRLVRKIAERNKRLFREQHTTQGKLEEAEVENERLQERVEELEGLG